MKKKKELPFGLSAALFLPFLLFNRLLLWLELEQRAVQTFSFLFTSFLPSFSPVFSELAPIANRLVVVVVVIEFPLFNLLLYFLVICPLCDLEVSEKEKEKVRIVSVCLCVCV